MKNLRKFKNYTPIQKVGYFMIIAGTLIILLKLFGLITVNHFVEEDLPNYLFLAGAFLILLPIILKKLRNKSKKNVLLLVLVFGTLGSISAQDYSKQINAFKQSFEEKSIEPIKPFISEELKFDPIPVANTPAILTNIVSNLPKLNSLTIIETFKGKVNVKYNFVGLGIRESAIHFDEEGKIARVELIENLIQQEMQAQQKLKESVQQPQMTETVKKHKPVLIEFKASDGLLISGNLYEIDKDKPIILLCHQAGYNRMEYTDIAPKLNELGYNCLAIDQRSGGGFAGKPNETFERAKEKGLPTDYVDAQKDIESAINFLQNKYNKKVIVWGSSYSSSLVLFESLQNKNVKATISFSPGDYFGDKKPSLKTVFSKIEKPFFITTSKEEAKTLSTLVNEIKLNDNQIQFIPESEGFHGSKALWEGQKGAEEYWIAVTNFLKSLLNN
jgi:dienelactone hydrolase